MMRRLPAKTTAPRAGEVLQRSRLFERIDDAPPAIWMVAPAGAGKSTLARSYAAARGLEPSWYRVDESDADPATLFDYLGRLVGGELPRYRHGSLERFASRFFEALYARLPEPALVVIDDCHAAGDAAEWGEVLRAAVLSLPAGVRLVMASRSPPPPAVSSLVARGAVALLGWPELGFSPEETAALLRGRSAVCSATDAHRLTGGWVAALVLLTERREGAAALEPGQPIFDLLSFEVFDRLEPAAREVLLSTSLLPTITEAMAESLSGRANASDVLRDLARAGMLVDRLDTEPAAYRYHALLSAFLRSRIDASAFGELSRRTAALLEEAGEVEQAAALHQEAGAHDALAELVSRHAAAWMSSGRSATLAHWLGRLPPDRITRDRWLSHWRASVLMGASPEQAAADYARAFDLALDADDTLAAALAWAGRAHAVVLAGVEFASLPAWRDRFERTIGESQLATLPAPVRAQVSLAMTLLLRLGTDGSAADSWADRALSEAREAGDSSVELMAGAIAVLQFGLGGDLPRAERVVVRLEQLASESGGEPLARIVQLLTRSMHAYLTVDHERCLNAVEQALAIGEREGIVVWRDSLLVYGVLACLGRRNVEQAEYFRALLSGLPARGRMAEVNLHTVNALVSHARGDPHGALRALAAAAAVARELGGDPIGVAIPLAGIAHIAIDVGDLEAAASSVAELAVLARGSNSVMLSYWQHLAAADLGLARGDEDADRELVAGLSIGRERGLVQAFYPPRQALSRLLARALGKDVEAEHARRVIAALDLEPPPGDVPVAWPRPVRVFTLGRFEIWCGDQLLARTGAPGKLLQALVAARPRQVAHTEICDLLWPDSDGDAARRALDTNLHRLRRALGRDDVVCLHEGRLSIDEVRCFVDADALEATCERALSDPKPEHERTLLALYQGPFLPTHDEPWVLSRRRRLERAFCAALRSLAAAREARGERREADALRQHAAEVAPD